MALAWRELKGLVLYPSEVLEGIVARRSLILSLLLGMVSYYGASLQISELLLPPTLGGQAYLLVNFPAGLGRMLLTILLIDLARWMVIGGKTGRRDLLAVWGYTQVPWILLSALSLAFFAAVPLVAWDDTAILWVLLFGGIALFLSLWALLLKLQALQVCYGVHGRRLWGVIALALLGTGLFTGLERSFLYERGLVPQTALYAMDPTASPVRVGRKNLSLPFDMLTYHVRSPERGEVVGFVPPGPARPFPLVPGFRLRSIGRIIALPGETVAMREGQVFIDQQPLSELYLQRSSLINITPTEVPPGHFFILGDNREAPMATYGGGVVGEKRIHGRLTDVGRLKWRLMLGTWPW